MVGVLCALPPPARGQNTDLRLFAPVASPDGGLAVPGTRTLGHLVLFGAVQLEYANDLLVGRRGEAIVTRPVAHRASAEVLLALGVLRRLDVSLALPVYLHQAARDWPTPGDDSGNAGLGDLRLAAKVMVLDGRRFRGFGLAAVAELTVPSGRSGRLMRDASASFTPGIVADWRWAGRLLVAASLGWRVRGRTTVADLAVDDELRLGLAAVVDLRRAGLSLVGEVVAAVGFGRTSRSQPLVDAIRAPAEGLLAARWRHRSGWLAQAGVGLGLTGGYGAPDLRLLLSVGHVVGLTRAARARLAAGSAAPRPPAGRPRVDDARRPPPPRTPPPPAPRRPRAAVDFDVAVDRDPDPDGDGIPAPLDRCPLEPEDRDGFQDDDGCPDPDNDGDGIPDVRDRCPDAPETVNGFEDEDGCPDQGSGSVSVQGEKIEIQGRIHFETSSDRIKPESHGILKQVAALLRASPRIRAVRVEGHTDDQGDRERNVDLSIRRAYRVRAFLVKEGVADDRLVAEGYGPTRPLVRNTTVAGRAQNRRVDFVILKVDPVPGGAR
jgi:outer membrane protein OmpA-like peptidoglycan-associated protein